MHPYPDKLSEKFIQNVSANDDNIISIIKASLLISKQNDYDNNKRHPHITRMTEIKLALNFWDL